MHNRRSSLMRCRDEDIENQRTIRKPSAAIRPAERTSGLIPIVGRKSYFTAGGVRDIVSGKQANRNGTEVFVLSGIRS